MDIFVMQNTRNNVNLADIALLCRFRYFLVVYDKYILAV